MTVKIDRLNLRLPSGFEPRAKAISQQIGVELNRQSWSHEVNIACLQLSPISVSSHEGDSAVAQKVVAAIVQGIERSRN